MAVSTVNSGVTSQVTAAITGNGTEDKSSKETLAANFTAFLQLLTTQLKNQNPLDPLDTNQFTQQLVQFAQVEQQLKSNDQLSTLVSLQKSSQQTQALGYVGTTVAVDGTTAQLKDKAARWLFSVQKPSTATITITNSTGQTVYSNTRTLQAGDQDFNWDGRSSDGTTQLPDGAYKISVTAKDVNSQSVAVSTEVQGQVDSVDMTQDPPILSIGGQTFTLDKIKRVLRAAS
jgi:flagellar basal-body rod modification protein FlgD